MTFRLSYPSSTMRRSLLLSSLGLSLLLTACVDTTGLSEESSKQPRGNQNSAVVVTEYADFQCPACQSAFSILVEPLLQKYGSQVKFEYKQFPLQNIHPYAMVLAEGSECAADQGKFWEYVDTMFPRLSSLESEGKTLSRQLITDVGQEIGVDADLFERCTRSRIKKNAVLADYNEGREKGVIGTPTFFVNGQKVASDLTAISAAVDAALTGTANRL